MTSTLTVTGVTQDGWNFSRYEGSGLCRDVARSGGRVHGFAGFISGGPEVPRGLLHDDPASAREVLDKASTAVLPPAQRENLMLRKALWRLQAR
jgi:hypothetical protein